MSTQKLTAPAMNPAAAELTAQELSATPAAAALTTDPADVSAFSVDASNLSQLDDPKAQCSSITRLCIGQFSSATCYMVMMFFSLSTAINCVVLDESIDDPVEQCIPHEDSQRKYALLITIQRAVTFVFGSFLGNLSDTFGRKPMITGALLGYGLTAVLMFIGTKAVAYTPFLIGSIILGFAAPLFPHAAAAVTDISTPKDLAKNMGIMQGVGLQLGLLSGSIVAFIIVVVNTAKQDDDPSISNISRNFTVLETSFLVSFIIGLSGAFMLLVFFSETLHKGERVKMDWASANPLSGMFRVTRTKYFFCCGLLVFLGAFAAAASESIFLNWIVTRFSLYKWVRNENLCPKTIGELNVATRFNVSHEDQVGSGFRCCTWDAELHGHEWTPADWGNVGAAYMPPGSASGLLEDGVTVGLGGAGDRGSILAPTLLKPDGSSCMATPGDFSPCAGYDDALRLATDAAEAQALDNSSSVYADALEAYAAAGGVLTAANGSAFESALAPFVEEAIEERAESLVGLYLFGHPDPAQGIPGTKTNFGMMNNAGCGDPTLPDAEVCPGLGFPICIPDGVDLVRVMAFLLPYLFALGIGQAVMLRLFDKVGLTSPKGQIMLLLVATAAQSTYMAWLPTFDSFYIFVFTSFLTAAAVPAVVSLFMGQAVPGEKGAVAGSFRTIEAGGKALGSFVIGTVYMATYYNAYPAQGLKWDRWGVANYDTELNVIGGDLLDKGRLCAPADNLLGAMNPYKTRTAARPFAQAEAHDLTSPVHAAAVLAYNASGGVLRPGDAGYAAALEPHLQTAIDTRVGQMIGGCLPKNGGDGPCDKYEGCGVIADAAEKPWCEYDFLPGEPDSGSCALSNTYDMFADPPFPGLPLLLVGIPFWIMVVVFAVMECTSIRDSDASGHRPDKEDAPSASALSQPSPLSSDNHLSETHVSTD